MSEAKVLVISNPVSGNGGSAPLLEGIRGRCLAALRLSSAIEGGDPSAWPLVETTADGSWRAMVETYVKVRGTRTVAVLGGDGTMMQVAELLYGLCQKDPRIQIALIPIPGGRGNDFARAYYGYSAADGGFWDWASVKVESGGFRWRKQKIDLASANGRLFINMASIGYGGRVVENAHTRKAFWSKTPLVYQVEGALALATGGDTSVDVKVDGQSVYTGPFFGAFVGNGKANGSGLFWCREARFDDGRIDGIVFPKPGMLDMIRTMAAIKSTDNPPPPIPMRHKQLRGVEIAFHFDRPTALELDGDFIGNAMSHGFKCLPSALNSWVLKK